MALMNCPECGRRISDKAVSCLSCGMTISKEVTVQSTHKIFKALKILSFFVAVIGAIILSIGVKINGELIPYGLATIFGSIIVLLFARIGAWWTTG